MARAAVFAALICVASGLQEHAFSFEEADGAIATAEQHIVQEQSHIIETLNRKLAQMKNELERDGKKIDDLENEKTDLKTQVDKTKDLLERTRQTALTNQETLKASIGKWKAKERSERDALVKEMSTEEKLRQDAANAQRDAAQSASDAEDARRQYRELMEQKKAALKRAGEIKEAKAKHTREAFAKDQARGSGIAPNFLSTQTAHGGSGARNLHHQQSMQRRQNFLQGEGNYQPHRPMAWGPAQNNAHVGGESMF